MLLVGTEAFEALNCRGQIQEIKSCIHCILLSMYRVEYGRFVNSCLIPTIPLPIFFDHSLRIDIFIEYENWNNIVSLRDVGFPYIKASIPCDSYFCGHVHMNISCTYSCVLIKCLVWLRNLTSCNLSMCNSVVWVFCINNMNQNEICVRYLTGKNPGIIGNFITLHNFRRAIWH